LRENRSLHKGRVVISSRRSPSPRFGDVALIAEIKKAVTFCGCICEDFDPVRIAREY